MHSELIEVTNKINEYSNRDLNKMSSADNQLIKDLINSYVECLLTKNSSEEISVILSNPNSNILHIAAKFGVVDQLKKILDFLESISNSASEARLKAPDLKFYLDLRDVEFFTMLHHAAKNGQAEVVNLLLMKGAESNPKASPQNRQWTPIHYAAKIGNLEIVKSLLEYKVDKETKTSFGLTPFVVAAEFGHAELLKFLLGLGSAKDVQTTPENHCMNALHYAAVGGFKEVATILIEAGLDVGTKTTSGYTALHFAAISGNVEMVEIILRGGAEIDAEDSEGKSAFYIAVAKNYVAMVSALLKWGVAVNKAVLQVAKDNKSSEILKIIDNYQKSLKALSGLKNIPDNFDQIVSSFTKENLFEAKINLKDGLFLNAYGIMNLKWEMGFFGKKILNLLEIADKSGNEKLFQDLVVIEKMISIATYSEAKSNSASSSQFEF